MVPAQTNIYIYNTYADPLKVLSEGSGSDKLFFFKYTEQQWKRYTWIVCDLYTKLCKLRMQMKRILMFKYWVMHNSKRYTDYVTRKHMKAT